MKKETIVPDEWRAFVELLNSSGVEYLVVGAVALAFHGFPRYTGDLDIFVRSTAENASRLERVLVSFGLESLGLTAADFVGSYQVVQLGIRPNRIDILTSLEGVSFGEAWASRIQAEYAGLPVSFIGREALVKNKRSNPRPQDRADLNALQKLKAPQQRRAGAKRKNKESHRRGD